MILSQRSIRKFPSVQSKGSLPVNNSGAFHPSERLRLEVEPYTGKKCRSFIYSIRGPKTFFKYQTYTIWLKFIRQMQNILQATLTAYDGRRQGSFLFRGCWPANTKTAHIQSTFYHEPILYGWKVRI